MAYENTFKNALIQLEGLGLLDVLLPFLLIFTLVFAVLQKSRILGPGHTSRFNTIVAVVISLAAVIPHVMNPGGPADVVSIINNALPNVSLLMIACFMALLLIGVFGNDVNIAGSGLAGWVVIFSIIAVGYTFLASAGVLDNPPAWAGFIVDPETRSLLVAVLVFGIIVWFITKEEHPPDPSKQPWYKNMADTFSGVYGKK
ncbi:MAG: hypothetical protein HGA85_07290 [Nanoarchaeota archaeon]|nr:hypothetical protein [Nanoarchaeota archaeon]